MYAFEFSNILPVNCIYSILKLNQLLLHSNSFTIYFAWE